MLFTIKLLSGSSALCGSRSSNMRKSNIFTCIYPFFFLTLLLFDFSTVLFYLRRAAPLTWGKGSIGGWSQRTSKAKALDRTWQWAWNWERISQRDQKKGTAAYQKHSLILVYWRLFFFSIVTVSRPTTVPLCCILPFFFCGQLQYTFSRERRSFGRPVCFSDRSAADAQSGLIGCASYQDSKFSIKRVQLDFGIQAIPTLQSSSAQTQWCFSKPVHADTAIHRQINKLF